MDCEKCGKKFRDRWNLSAHKARLRPCVKIPEKTTEHTNTRDLTEFPK